MVAFGDPLDRGIDPKALAADPVRRSCAGQSAGVRCAVRTEPRIRPEPPSMFARLKRQCYDRDPKWSQFSANMDHINDTGRDRERTESEFKHS